MIAAALAAALIAGPPPAVAPTAQHPIVVGERRLSRGWLRHWADIVRRSGTDEEHSRSAAADLLIRYRWIAGEASERGVVVTRGEVDRAFRKQRDETFPRRRDYRRFLRESGQSHADVRWRVRIDLHSDRLRELATAGATTPQEQQDRLDAFVVAFHAKWRARTACRAPWVGRDCGTTSPGRTRRAPSRGRRTSSWGGGGGDVRFPSTAPVVPSHRLLESDVRPAGLTAAGRR